MLSLDANRPRAPRLDRPSGAIDEARTAAVASKFRPAPPPAESWRKGRGPFAWLGRLLAAWRARVASPPLTRRDAAEPAASPDWASLTEQFGSYAAAARAELANDSFEFGVEPADLTVSEPSSEPLAVEPALDPAGETERISESAPLPPGQSLGEALATVASPQTPVAAEADPPRDAVNTDGEGQGFRVSAATLPAALLEACVLRQVSRS